MDEFNRAFQSEILSTLPKLRRFAYALTGSAHEADDLMQSTIERALRKKDRYRDDGRLDSWLMRLCKNLWIDEIRRRKARPQTDEISDMTTPVLDGVRAMEAKMQMKDMNSALAEMSDNQRAVLLLVAVEGQTYQEAAAVLNVPVGTVMSRLARARARLADYLQLERAEA